MALIPKPLMQIKAESLHFSHTTIVWFKIHCSDVEKQNYKNGVFVQQIMDLIVYPINTFISVI